MIGRLVLVAAGVIAAAAGAAAMLKKKAERDQTDADGSISNTTLGTAATSSAANAAKSGSVAESGDDLRKVKGIGDVSAERLAGIGIDSYAQIAAWSADDIESVSEQIKVSPQRIRREDWAGQAKALEEAAA